MLNFIDDYLNKTTMYRLVLYYLIALLGGAFILSMFGLLPNTPTEILISTAVLVVCSLITNAIFANIFDAVPNIESVYLTALILALIISPSLDPINIIFMFWAAVLATGSKYILAYHKKHFFNPAAIAVVLTAFVLNQSASWHGSLRRHVPLSPQCAKFHFWER